ncbi:MAG: hypothetical protein R6W79_09035, partial [Acidimicrobiia bacterium]
TLGMWLAIPWFIWRRRTPEAIFAVAGNLLFSIRVIPEIKDYIALRRSGKIVSVGTWRDFFSSYPALDPNRDHVPESSDTAG